ncbi:hypothetical protein [Nonomuraea africana]|uniref:Uncharacterized protein n=1 Tax=Nonomuraea africana TaxID=46171 RepID=A0ABR9KRS1_9ACTN|nr:hypothetical protein [Nonomuraea africana]MBE1564298.1 hypothetical protein [Nonomuraea africana]
MEGQPVVKTPWRVVGLVVRVVLLAILLWGGVVSGLSTFPREGTAAELRAALDDKDTIVYLVDAREVRWSNHPLHWRRLIVNQDGSLSSDAGLDLEGRIGGDSDPAPEDPDEPREIDVLLAAAELRGVTVVRADGDNWPPAWFEDVPARYGWLVPLAWFATLLAMLARSRPRYANRWGWFWMFFFGGVGAPLYLLLEPQPIWAAMDGPMPPARSRLDGGGGCLMALLLALVSGLGLIGLGALFG